MPLTSRMVCPIRNPAASKAVPLPWNSESKEEKSWSKQCNTFWPAFYLWNLVFIYKFSRYEYKIGNKDKTKISRIRRGRAFFVSMGCQKQNKTKLTSIVMMRGNGCRVSAPPSMAIPRMVLVFRMTTSVGSSPDTGRRPVYANQSPSLLSSSTPTVVSTYSNDSGKLRSPSWPVVGVAAASDAVALSVLHWIITIPIDKTVIIIIIKHCIFLRRFEWKTSQK